MINWILNEKIDNNNSNKKKAPKVSTAQIIPNIIKAKTENSKVVTKILRNSPINNSNKN